MNLEPQSRPSPVSVSRVCSSMPLLVALMTLKVVLRRMGGVPFPPTIFTFLFFSSLFVGLTGSVGDKGAVCGSELTAAGSGRVFRVTERFNGCHLRLEGLMWR